MGFENRTVCIAVSGSDAGIACAKNYLDLGARVAVYYNEPERIRTLDTEKFGDKLKLIQISDFKNADELIKAGEGVIGEWEKIDIAVAAVTMADNEKGLDMSEEEYQDILKTISSGTLFFIQPLLQNMMDHDYGRVAIVMSIGGRINLPGVSPAYAAANASLGGITRNIASTAGVHYVTANAVAVGPLTDGSYKAGTSDVKGIIAGHETGTPEDVAKAVEYLTADLASWTTGEILDLNGGFLMI
ncbi:MAG: SDR family oxidoreductase [Lachnospiraceae bacterium]|nr:SDR family oxidoreductase [Lachnospiraceae bacterium]